MAVKSLSTATLLVSGVAMVMMLSSAFSAVALPPLPQETRELLEECARKLTPECAEEIRLNGHENGTVSDKCCKALLAEGEECYSRLARVVAAYSSDIRKVEPEFRTLQIWNHCAETAAAAPSN